MNPTTLILSRLGLAVQTSDGYPNQAPVVPYAAVYDDSGHAQRHRQSIRAHWVTWTHRVVVVAHTRDGLRATVAAVRDCLTSWRPIPDASPMTEQFAGPVLTDGPDGDRRHSQTLTYTHQTPRSPR